ncbi:MAG: tetratricopeptide repeat protein [Bacteroides sp.]|nr:tetratricopeptide repeat protein [Bacteroides sp.]
MKKEDISSKKNNILSSISSGRLAPAFKQLRSLSELLMTWETTDEINRLEQSYRYMLDYAMRGVADPSRNKVYNDIVRRMRRALDSLERHALTGDASTLYFNTLRYINMSNRESIASMLRRYETLTNDYWTTGAHLEPNSQASRENRSKRESLERDIFNSIWTTFPLGQEDVDAIANVFTSQRYYTPLKQFVISALLLGLFEYYDSRRIELLIDAYQSDDSIISPVACIALVLSLYHYRDREPAPAVVSRLKLLSDNPQWHTDLRDAFLELVRARDTERLTRTMQEEVVPEIMKMRPEISRRFSNLESLGTESLDMDINPEWQDMLEKSGVADKMRQLFEIQLEGGDVFMSTFAHLKSYPFFSDISNWFMPFHSDRSELIDNNDISDIVNIMESSPIFCNSDKFSFILSLKNIPASQRDLVKSQLNAQVDGLIELQNSSLDKELKKRSSIMNRYVQDLYRFFKLFRRKGEFKDPFKTDLNLVTVPALSSEFNDIDSLQAIAEFYFKYRYYTDALNLFKAIENLSCPDIQLFEKMGFCYEKLGDFELALQYYEQAELLNAESLWTLKHLASTHRMLGNPARALEYYKRVLEKEDSDSVRTNMAIGNCYLEMEQYEQALKYYYKVNYLDDKAQRANRQMAWCHMMLRDFEKAKSLYTDVVSNKPMPGDYLNLGHLALAMNDEENALNYYKLYITQGTLTLDSFAEKLQEDTDALSRMGIDTDIIPLIVDAISYSIP